MADETKQLPPLPGRGLHRPGDDEVGPVIFETGEAMPQAPSTVTPPPQRLEDAPTDALEIVSGDPAAAGAMTPVDEPLSPEEQKAAREAAKAQLDADAEARAAAKTAAKAEPKTPKP